MPVPLVMVTVVPVTEQLPVAPNVTAPVPLPPLLPTVDVVPSDCAVPGTPVTVSVAWVARVTVWPAASVPLLLAKVDVTLTKLASTVCGEPAADIAAVAGLVAELLVPFTAV